jgi:hypothetical protein
MTTNPLHSACIKAYNKGVKSFDAEVKRGNDLVLKYIDDAFDRVEAMMRDRSPTGMRKFRDVVHEVATFYTASVVVVNGSVGLAQGCPELSKLVGAMRDPSAWPKVFIADPGTEASILFRNGPGLYHVLEMSMSVRWLFAAQAHVNEAVQRNVDEAAKQRTIDTEGKLKWVLGRFDANAHGSRMKDARDEMVRKLKTPIDNARVDFLNVIWNHCTPGYNIVDSEIRSDIPCPCLGDTWLRSRHVTEENVGTDELFGFAKTAYAISSVIKSVDTWYENKNEEGNAMGGIVESVDTMFDDWKNDGKMA